jgi:hypothetical protein
MVVQPGKPGAPSERVEVALADGLCRISAARTAPEGTVLAAGDARLDRDACRSLWREIDRLSLDEFAADEQPGPADDFGSVTLVVEDAFEDETQAHRSSWSWSRPLVDPGRADAVASLLARRARAAIPDVPLFYFPEE